MDAGGGGSKSDNNSAQQPPPSTTPPPTTPPPSTPPPSTPPSTPPPSGACLAGGESSDPGGNYPLPTFTPSPMPNHPEPAKMDEHLAALNLVEYSRTTNAAITSGSWCNPDTWHNKTVPGDDAIVVIMEGVTVEYDVMENSRLNTLRVDGTLNFSTTQSTQLIVDTMVVDPRGTLVVGTEQNPIPNGVQVDIIFADNGDIDVNWDPMLLSRGLIAHGQSRIHGAQKSTHHKVSIDPAQGDTIVTLAQTPTNWQVGDTVIVAGTHYIGWKWSGSAVTYHGTEDEVRTISAVNGNQITLDQPLDYNHFSARADLKTNVVNYSRNVKFVSENGASLPVHRRAHTMFMHNDDVDVRYAEFLNLGRTDKSRDTFEVANINPVITDSNIRGRYSFHFHRAGISDQRNPAIAIGNAVYGSPGWGFVQHDSHAQFYENASFDTHGAGFIAETGNETGTWVNNIALKAEGNRSFNPKNGQDAGRFDIARTGAGFWFTGRMVKSVNNIAASVNHGFVYLHRGTGMLNFPPETFMLPEALGYEGFVNPDDAPIRNFHNNEAYASTVGMYVVKANPKQQHDVYTVLSDFTAWEVEAGAAIEYTSHYLVKNFDLIGSDPHPGHFHQPDFGIEFGQNTTDTVVLNATIADFPEGIRLVKTHTDPNHVGKDQYVVVGTQYINVSDPLPTDDNGRTLYEPGIDQILTNSDLTPGQFTIDINEPMEFTSPSTAYPSGELFTGTKTDSIGPIPLPAGADDFRLSASELIAQLEQFGYYRTAANEPYAIVEYYFSDRATGEIKKTGFKLLLSPSVESAIQNNQGGWGNAIFAGIIDLNSQSPVGNNDSASTTVNTTVDVNLLANDSDPDGDTIVVDGIVQPLRGMVFDNGDGTITYQPDIYFTGTDDFYYWVSDGQGNFSRADVSITVNP